MDAALAEERTERREQMIRKRGKEVYGEQREGGRGCKHGRNVERKRGTEGKVARKPTQTQETLKNRHRNP